MIPKCECGNDTFNVKEELLYKAAIDEGKLTIFKKVNSYTEDIITCCACGKEYSLERDFNGEVDYGD